MSQPDLVGELLASTSQTKAVAPCSTKWPGLTSVESSVAYLSTYSIRGCQRHWLMSNNLSILDFLRPGPVCFGAAELAA